MRRRLLILAAFLLAGAVVNVAVAWGVAVRTDSPLRWKATPDQEGLYSEADDGEYRWCQIVSRTGFQQLVWEKVVVAAVPVALSGDVAVESGTIRRIIDSSLYDNWLRRITRGHFRYLSPARFTKAVPRWGEPPTPHTPGIRVKRAFGWPALALWYESSIWPSSAASGAWTWPEGFSVVGPSRHLPCRIVALGFAVNTLFYAAVLWLLICGPFALRRLIRRQRGLCLACGYDLRHGEQNACSECGRDHRPTGTARSA